MGYHHIALRAQLPYRFRGKYRIVPKTTMHDLLKLRADFEREEQNMLILRHPYLTVEQSHGHMKEIRENTFPKIVMNKLEERNAKFARRHSIEDYLKRLTAFEKWD